MNYRRSSRAPQGRASNPLPVRYVEHTPTQAPWERDLESYTSQEEIFDDARDLAIVIAGLKRITKEAAQKAHQRGVFSKTFHADRERLQLLGVRHNALLQRGAQLRRQELGVQEEKGFKGRFMEIAKKRLRPETYDALIEETKATYPEPEYIE